MSGLDPFAAEMRETRMVLGDAAASSKDGFDDRMRRTVREVLSDRYSVKVRAVTPSSGPRLVDIVESADWVGDLVFGPDPGGRRQLMRELGSWERARPFRVYAYVLRIVDLVPPEFLVHLIRSSRRLSAEDFVYFYEGTKGEAIQNDYVGEPTGLDLSWSRVTPSTT